MTVGWWQGTLSEVSACIKRTHTHTYASPWELKTASTPHMQQSQFCFLRMVWRVGMLLSVGPCLFQWPVWWTWRKSTAWGGYQKATWSSRHSKGASIFPSSVRPHWCLAFPKHLLDEIGFSQRPLEGRAGQMKGYKHHRLVLSAKEKGLTHVPAYKLLFSLKKSSEIRFHSSLLRPKFFLAIWFHYMNYRTVIE